MKKIFFLLSAALFSLTACGSDDNSGNEPTKKPDPVVDTNKAFVKGADISWYTEMAADGRKFYNATGTPQECPALMKELGIQAIRLRVWVHPENKGCNYSNTADVVAKAQAAAAQGMDVMLDFHYSDWWADPSRQETPAAWTNCSFEALLDSVKLHTTAVLQAVKDGGVSVKWVQVGNETRNGMLHPYGQLWNEKGDIDGGWHNYAALSNTGYAAVKSVFPGAKVIVHLNHAYEDNLWWVKNFKLAGGKFDLFGVSHYPQADDTSKSALTLNALAATNIKLLANTYAVPVMVTEVGVEQADAAASASILYDFLTRMKALGTDVCAGAFYWEPEVYGNWKPSSYASFGWGAYTQGAFTAAGKPSKVMETFVK